MAPPLGYGARGGAEDSVGVGREDLEACTGSAGAWEGGRAAEATADVWGMGLEDEDVPATQKVGVWG